MGSQADMLAHNTGSGLRAEHRSFERVKAGIKLTLGRRLESGGDIDRPALSRDISRSGVACTTQHRVSIGDRVRVMLSTQGSPHAMALPERISGHARVVRIERKNSSTRLVALRFDEEMAGSMELGFFMAWLLGRGNTPEPA